MHVHCNLSVTVSYTPNIKLARKFIVPINDPFALFLVTFEPIKLLARESGFTFCHEKDVIKSKQWVVISKQTYIQIAFLNCSSRKEYR